MDHLNRQNQLGRTKITWLDELIVDEQSLRESEIRMLQFIEVILGGKLSFPERSCFFELLSDIRAEAPTGWIERSAKKPKNSLAEALSAMAVALRLLEEQKLSKKVMEERLGDKFPKKDGERRGQRAIADLLGVAHRYLQGEEPADVNAGLSALPTEDCVYILKHYGRHYRKSSAVSQTAENAD